jgi:hypothetical protein
MTPPHLCDYLPSEEDMAHYFNNFELPSVHQGWFVASLIEIGLLVLEKIFSPIKTHVKMVLFIVPLSDLRGPWFE